MVRLFCLIGLGNPGRQYLQTRHNAGFLVIDRIADEAKIKLDQKGFRSAYGKGLINGEQVILVKPQTFMNLSGEAAGPIIRYYRIPLEQVLIIYDDLDLPLGTIRIRLSGSAGGHNGLSSVLTAIGDQAVPRLRVGIGRPVDETVVNYVLTPFSGADLGEFKASIIRAAQAGVSFVTEGAQAAMNRFNRNLIIDEKESNQPN